MGQRLVLFAALTAVALGVALMAATGDVAARAVGLALFAVGAVALALLFFYAVGRSEDRDRAAEARRRPPRR